MEEEEEGRQRGHAKGPPGRCRRAGPSGGRAEAAPRRAHTRAPTPPPAAPRPRGRAAARGTVQPVGDARQLQGRPRPPPPRPPRGPRHPGRDGACPPAAPRHSPRRGCLPGARGFSSPPTPHPPPGKRRGGGGGGRPGLSGAGFGGKPSFSSFSSRCSFPPQPSSATPDPLRSSPGPSAATVSAPTGDSGLAGGAGARPAAEPRGWSAPPPPGELSEVCHFARGYRVARKRCSGVSAPRRAGRPDTPSGEASGRGGQGRGSAHTYSGPGGESRAGGSPTPPSSGRPSLHPPPRARTGREVAKQNPPSPAPRLSPTLFSEPARRRRRRRRQKEAPPAKFNPHPSLPPSALTLEGSCTPNAKPPANWISLQF